MAGLFSRSMLREVLDRLDLSDIESWCKTTEDSLASFWEKKLPLNLNKTQIIGYVVDYVAGLDDKTQRFVLRELKKIEQLNFVEVGAFFNASLQDAEEGAKPYLWLDRIKSKNNFYDSREEILTSDNHTRVFLLEAHPKDEPHLAYLRLAEHNPRIPKFFPEGFQNLGRTCNTLNVSIEDLEAIPSSKRWKRVFYANWNRILAWKNPPENPDTKAYVDKFQQADCLGKQSVFIYQLLEDYNLDVLKELCEEYLCFETRADNQLSVFLLSAFDADDWFEIKEWCEDSKFVHVITLEQVTSKDFTNFFYRSQAKQFYATTEIDQPLYMQEALSKLELKTENIQL